ncbi:MFS transporter, partial [Clostridium perfringens]
YLFDLDINFPYISASIVLILCFFLAMRAGRAWAATEAVMSER